MITSAVSQLQFLGIGHYYPRRAVNNDELAHLFAGEGNAVDQAVLGAIDIQSRHWAADDETVVYMACQAVERALADAGVDADSIDLLILSNWTDRQFIPEHAPQVAQACSMPRALAFDISGACSGFVMGVQLVNSMLSTGPYRRAVLVSCDRFSKRVRPNSKGQLVVGDAAAAVVVERQSGATGLMGAVMHSDGHNHALVTALPPQGWIKSQPQLVDTAVQSNLQVIEELLTSTGTSIEEVDWVIPHPGTNVVHQGIMAATGIPKEKFLFNFEQRGNTGSASVPIALSEFFHAGQVKRGDLILSPAVGSGWYFGGLLYRW